ncbi:transcription factor GTE8-like isoform X2 [Henckelia pumila]|uniref:transcription factor GTE8-like isoform X2 n=1 Tax=Henckelia pumila TaxID=405737 RepID=UPI003C6DC811
MAKKDRIPSKYAASFASRYESEGSGSSDHIDSTEDSAALMRKWIDLNSASRNGFAIPVQILPVSKLSSFDRKNLALRLTSELGQIQLLQKKLELQETKLANSTMVSSSSDILSCSNAQHKGFQVGAAKKSSLLGSGLDKKVKGIKGRFVPANRSMPSNPNARLLKQCENLLKKLMSQDYAWVFNTPVDVVKLNIPDYSNVIKSPMDLGTIKGRFNSGEYASPLDFLADVRLTFTNAKTYNPPGSDVHFMADTMSQFFELRWKAIEKKLVNNSQSPLEKSGVHVESEMSKPAGPSKKRKVSPALHELNQPPIKWKMTDEEKHELGRELEDMLGDLPDNVIEFLRAQSSDRDNEEDEIEIDIDVLSDDTLFTLRKLLNDHLHEKQQNQAKSEACEMELPNEPGLSNSSLQVEKEYNEDLDIGGNMAPVTSYPPARIGKVAAGGAYRCSDAGPESRTTSDKGSELSKDSSGLKQTLDDAAVTADSKKKSGVHKPVDELPSVGELDQQEQTSLLKPHGNDSDANEDGVNAQAERQVSPDKLYRAALLKNRFADTILKAQEKTLGQDDKGDPEKLRREREELEIHKKREKARLQAEAKAAEDSRRQAEAEAAAELKRQRELEREAAREALLKMEKTVEMNENYRFVEDQTHDGFGDFNFGGCNPLEQLGLYMKDEEEEDGELTSFPNVMEDVEEGEID